MENRLVELPAMPLFEFICSSCGEEFEEIVSSGSHPSCPHCGSEELQKKWSAFAVSGGGRSGVRREPAAAPVGGG